MAINFKPKTAQPSAQPVTPPKKPRGRPPKPPVTHEQKLKKARKERYDEKRAAKAEQRAAINRAIYEREHVAYSAEMRAEMDARHIPCVPEDIEAAIDEHVISAQEIIERWERIYEVKLGPFMRKYVVANFFAKSMGSDKDIKANEYCDEVADLVIERMCNGESLNHICKDKFMPNSSRFLTWCAQRPELDRKYALAQRVMGNAAALRALEVAANPRMGVTLTSRADGTVDIVTADMVNRSRLHAQMLQWYASKVVPSFANTPANGHAPGDVSTGSAGGIEITLTGGLPDQPLGELATDAEKWDAINAAKKTRFITKEQINNPLGIDINADDGYDDELLDGTHENPGKNADDNGDA